MHWEKRVQKLPVVDINKEAAETVVSELNKRNIDAIAVRADITNEDDVQAMVKDVIEAFGSLTIAVNNAGIGNWRDAISMEMAEWKKIIDVNLNSVYLCAREELKK
jgi:NAD(P)-dependent dehydrogenase (short-subunit alcohol dehydrogenase family)